MGSLSKTQTDKQKINALNKTIKAQAEQISEMQLLLDKANEQLQKGSVANAISVFEPSYTIIKNAAKVVIERYPNFQDEKEKERHILQATTMFEIMLKEIKEAQK